jgi:electron transport complex protein RnfB
MITGIIVAAVVVGCVGIILGFFLGIAGEKFKVETDPRGCDLRSSPGK